MRNSAPSKVRLVTVSEEDAGQRLDNFLMRQLRRVPRALVYRIVRKGQVRVNKKRARVSDRLRVGDVVRIPPVQQAAPAPQRAFDEAARTRFEALVLYEDNDLMALNKPSGMAVHGGSGLSWGLIELARAARPRARRLELVHRLDRDTSGIILLAKKASVLKALHAQVREHRLKKIYQALVAGRWPRGCALVDAPLLKNTLQSGERIVRVSSEGKPSRSRFRVLAACERVSRIEVRIETGRTHQIRVHTLHAGHPVLGDEKYGDAGANRQARACGLRRLALHAWRLGFEHPATGQWLELEAPVPQLFTEVFECLCQQKSATG
ncbi:23S rRNA pseudouridine(955/2504/2580) synthase RluC [Sulfurivirga sp.]|uniref:23S rRNA pseudouridine(955/2504/2580) synthase RluC n=1 Tax=Sulfurivirga sp. TaxID=2614236 RepID=UPI0025FE1F80|nr:23S rRNA pseudouridine(955/2504/2580) synthase RluC [Sulfurivirga sp.]